jgi:CRP-like cAMP-binding protein
MSPSKDEMAAWISDAIRREFAASAEAQRAKPPSKDEVSAWIHEAIKGELGRLHGLANLLAEVKTLLEGSVGEDRLQRLDAISAPDSSENMNSSSAGSVGQHAESPNGTARPEKSANGARKRNSPPRKIKINGAIVNAQSLSTYNGGSAIHIMDDDHKTDTSNFNGRSEPKAGPTAKRQVADARKVSPFKDDDEERLLSEPLRSPEADVKKAMLFSLVAGAEEEDGFLSLKPARKPIAEEKESIFISPRDAEVATIAARRNRKEKNSQPLAVVAGRERTASEGWEPGRRQLHKDQEDPWFMLQPGGAARSAVDVVFLMLLFYEAYYLPLQICTTLAAPWSFHEVVIISLFLLESCALAVTGFEEHFILVMEPQRSALRYLTKWLPLDCFTLICAVLTNPALGLHRAVACGRLLRIARLPSTVERLKIFVCSYVRMPLEIATSYASILTFITHLFLSVHVFTTWWLWIADSALEPDARDEDAWLARTMDDIPYLRRDKFYMYLHASNYVVAVFTGGEASVVPIKWTELVFSSGVNIVQIIFAAILTALVTNLFTLLSSSKKDFQEQDIVLQEFFYVHDVPKDLRQRVTRFLFLKFVQRSFVPTSEMVKDLPEALRDEVLVTVRAGYLETGHVFFRGLTVDALNFICAHSVDTFYMENDTMITVNSPANCAYFMTQGMALVLRQHGATVEMQAPCSLGEKSLFSSTRTRSATVVAVRPTVAIIVTRQVLEDCFRMHPANQEYYDLFCALNSADEPPEAEKPDAAEKASAPRRGFVRSSLSRRKTTAF